MTVRLYGSDKTIHRTEQVNVERDPKTGEVVSVWFRCMALPFTDHVCDTSRADDMRKMYKDHSMPGIKAVIVDDGK